MNIWMLDGREVFSIGMWVIICKVFMRAQSYFNDKPRNIDKIRFKETLPVSAKDAYLVKT